MEQTLLVMSENDMTFVESFVISFAVNVLKLILGYLMKVSYTTALAFMNRSIKIQYNTVLFI